VDAGQAPKEILRLKIEAWYSPREDVLRYRPQEPVSEQLREAMAEHKHELVEMARRERGAFATEAEVLDAFRECARRREGAIV
jgi:hypothetical protein